MDARVGRHIHADEEAIDGCACDIANDDSTATADDDLPPASGGVQLPRRPLDAAEDAIDGCDVDFRAAEQTSDDALPVAVGGVA